MEYGYDQIKKFDVVFRLKLPRGTPREDLAGFSSISVGLMWPMAEWRRVHVANSILQPQVFELFECSELGVSFPSFNGMRRIFGRLIRSTSQGVSSRGASHEADIEEDLHARGFAA